MSARVCAPALGLSLQQKIAPGASRRHAAVSHAALLPAGACPHCSRASLLSDPVTSSVHVSE